MSEEEEEELSPSTLILSKISQFFSIILSHPLYFSYFLFFSPYLLKVLSFLSPLFTTTFLLFLAFFFTFSTSHSHQNQLEHGQNIVPDDLPQHLEWFNTVFNTPTDIPINIPFPLELQEPQIKKEINTTTVFSHHLNKQEPKLLDDDHDRDHDITENGIQMGMNNKSFLGCKVFSVEDDQDKMDLLWEKYEEKEKWVIEEKSCDLKKKDSLRSLQMKMEEEEEEEEEEENNGKICCLQALKFSTGKMRFGMGKKSGFRKISKAFKGLKLLHQLATNGKNKTHS